MTSGDAGFGVRRGLECIWRWRTTLAEVGSRAGRNALLPVELAMNILARVLPAYTWRKKKRKRVEYAFESRRLSLHGQQSPSFMQMEIAAGKSVCGDSCAHGGCNTTADPFAYGRPFTLR